jgi:hypothetical protein
MLFFVEELAVMSLDVLPIPRRDSILSLARVPCISKPKMRSTTREETIRQPLRSNLGRGKKEQGDLERNLISNIGA